MFLELHQAHYRFLFPNTEEKARLAAVADGQSSRQPGDRFKMGHNEALQFYGLRLGGKHLLAFLHHRPGTPLYRAAVGDLLATLLGIANILNINLDKASLPPPDELTFEGYARIQGLFAKGAEDVDHVDRGNPPESGAYATMRSTTLHLAAWVVAAAASLNVPLKDLLEEAHARQRLNG